MSVNSMTFEQSAAFLTDLYKEATGQYPAIQITNTQDFTTVGTTLIQGGYDPIISALTQILDKTIWSIRPYAQKFKSLNVDERRWGAVTRKINFIDTALDTADGSKYCANLLCSISVKLGVYRVIYDHRDSGGS